MQTRLSIGLSLGVMVLSSLIPLAATPVGAQSRDRYGAHSYCERQARDYARRRASGGVIEGSIRGAIGGAILGGILGGRRGARRGARAGGAIGGIGGGVEQRQDRERFYRLEYDRCIRDFRLDY